MVESPMSDDSSDSIKEESSYRQLNAYRLNDFERTQLHKLRIEARAILVFTQPMTFFESLIEKVNQRIGETCGDTHKKQPQIVDVIWYDHNHWYETLWLGIQPWLNWANNYVSVIYAGFLSNPTNAWHSLRLTWLSWLLFFVLGPLLLAFTLTIELILYIAPELLGPLDMFGTSFIVNESMFEDVSDVSQQAAKELAMPTQVATYSHTVAEFLLNVSAAVYASKAEPHAQAEKLYRQFAARDGEPLPLKPFLHTHDSQRLAVQELLDLSQRGLLAYARRMNLCTITVSDLDSGYGGPAASMFWNIDSKSADQFLIVAITGTSLFDPRKWLIDASLQKVQVDPEFAPFVGPLDCNAHQGFYQSVFPDRIRAYQDWLTRDLDDLYPTRAIVQAIKCKALAIKADNPKLERIPLWLTGHSLGAAIAGLLFAHLSTGSNDLEDVIEVCGGYTFGTPMSTDHNFVCALQSGDDKQCLGRQLWRVINDDDFVARLPPNLNTTQTNGGVGCLSKIESGHTLFDGTILDYSSIGYGVKYLSSLGLPAGLSNTAFNITCTVPVVDVPTGGVVDSLINSNWSPLKIFLQHSPINYRSTLRKARAAIIHLQRRED